MNAEFNVKTEVKDGNIIEQSIDYIMDGVVHETITEIADTREKQFRDALIKMGWTPPTQIILPV